MPLGVMLASMACNLKTDRDISLHILESNISREDRDKIEDSVFNNKNGSGRLTFYWHKVEAERLENLPDAGSYRHITAEAYGRLFAPDVLPQSCNRVVYLDCDLIVLKDIAELNDAADDDHTISVVPTVRFPYVSSLFEPTRSVVFDYAQLGIPATNRYFQSGVMVMNLKLWRKRNITSRVLDYAKASKEKLLFVDQGALNAVLFDQWRRLDQRWNQTSTVLYPECWKPPAYTRSEWRQTLDDPFIIHYDSGDKPWNRDFRRPRSSFFHKYFLKTPFKRDYKIARVAALESMIGFQNYFAVWRMRTALGAKLPKKRK